MSCLIVHSGRRCGLQLAFGWSGQKQGRTKGGWLAKDQNLGTGVARKWGEPSGRECGPQGARAVNVRNGLDHGTAIASRRSQQGKEKGFDGDLEQ